MVAVVMEPPGGLPVRRVLAGRTGPRSGYVGECSGLRSGFKLGWWPLPGLMASPLGVHQRLVLSRSRKWKQPARARTLLTGAGTVLGELANSLTRGQAECR